MSHRYVFSGALALVVASSLLSSPAWADPLDPVQPPPSASSMVTATNAMLRPGDVVDTLVLPMPSYMRGYVTGFNNPAEGLDPPAVCSPGPNFTPVLIPGDEATGFVAQSGLVSQYVYQYGSDSGAQRAWTTVSDQIANRCTGPTSANPSLAIDAERIPGVGERGWAVVGSGDGSAYSTVYLVGDAIQLVVFNTVGQAFPSGALNAVQELSVVLAQRWVQRATLPLTQEQALTRAELSMIQPADVPSSLSILQPQAGALSNFEFRQPGSDMFTTCLSVSTEVMLDGDQSFIAGLGSRGGALTVNGNVSQMVSAYATQAAAQRAWEDLSRQAKRCTKGQNERIAGNENFQRATNGVSELTFGGVPGIWIRELTAFGGDPVNFSVKSYSILLFMGDAIQQVTYVIGRTGLRQVPLDQLPVNQLAEELAERWVLAAAG